MKELPAPQVKINDLYWSPRLSVNAEKGIFHPWKQLGVTRCNVDIFTVQLDSSSLMEEIACDLLGECVVIYGKTTEGKPLKYIPYFLWANRGESKMTVWVKAS